MRLLNDLHFFSSLSHGIGNVDRYGMFSSSSIGGQVGRQRKQHRLGDQIIIITSMQASPFDLASHYSVRSISLLLNASCSYCCSPYTVGLGLWPCNREAHRMVQPVASHSRLFIRAEAAGTTVGGATKCCIFALIGRACCRSNPQ